MSLSVPALVYTSHEPYGSTISLQFCLETGRALSDLLIRIPGQGGFIASLVDVDKCYGGGKDCFNRHFTAFCLVYMDLVFNRGINGPNTYCFEAEYAPGVDLLSKGSLIRSLQHATVIEESVVIEVRGQYQFEIFLSQVFSGRITIHHF